MMSMVGIVVMRCAMCGDTFPLHTDDERVCRSCGSDVLGDATEPLL